MALNLFHTVGKTIKNYPYPFFIFWVAVLIFGIVLFPLRGEKTDDVIDMWLPKNGQARKARNFVADIWKHQAAVAKYPGLVNQVENLGYHVNDDGWFRNQRKYFIIWAADKNWDYAEGSNGPSIQTKAHYNEWYWFNKELWTEPYIIDGESMMYSDVCATNFGTNAWHVGDFGLIQEAGFAAGKYPPAYTGGVAATDPGGLWNTFIAKYPDYRASTLDSIDTVSTAYMHNTLHSQAVIGFTAEALAGALYYQMPFKPCVDDTGTNCIRQFTESTDGDAATFVSQYNYNYNCRLFITTQNPLAAAFFDAQADGGLGMTPNEITYFCSNFLLYSSIPGATEFKNSCSIGDFTFCIKDSLTSLYGTIFQEPYVAAAIPNYDQLPTEHDLLSKEVEDAQFFAKLGNCSTNAFLTANNGRYIRSSKFVEQPLNIARRIQIKAGNCTLKHPSAALASKMWDTIGHPPALQTAEENVGWPAWKAAGTCLQASWLQGYIAKATEEGGRAQQYGALAQAAVLAGNASGAAHFQEQAGIALNKSIAWQATIAASNYAEDATYCMQHIINNATGIPYDPVAFQAHQANLGAVITNVGTAAATWAVWYKSAIYFECPEYTDEAIKTAMSWRDQLFDQIHERTNAFNAHVNTTKLRASVLSNKTEKEGYDELFNQNLILMIVALLIFFVMVVVIQWKNKVVAFCSVLLILMVVFATFGFMPPPYTPSVAQFLPYLSLGIGVDDLFVVLHHYQDEDNIAKAIHHAGATITMTSMVNVIVFISLYIISNVPDFHIFTSAAAIAVGLLWANVFLGVIPLLAFVERATGKDSDVTRPADDFDMLAENTMRGKSHHTELGAQGFKNYEWYSKKLEPFKCIGTPIVIIIMFLTALILSFMKLNGHGFEKIDFGLQLSQLVYDDIDDHAFRSVMILERFPLYSVDCGANKKWDAEDFLNNTFDDYAHDYIPYFHGFGDLTDTSYSSVNWIANMRNDGPQAYPYYTDMARTFPINPSAWVYWYDWDHATQTDIVVPESTIYISPADPPESGIVSGRDITDAVRRLYDYLDNHKDIGAYCTSNILQVYERYLDVEESLYFGLAVCAAIVFTVGLVMIQDIGATFILTLTTMATAYQLWGFYGFATLRINSFLTLCITLGAAFTVQYTAHVNKRFVKSMAPSRWYRVVDALSCYTAPILYGGLTTAVAVSAAAFLPAKYFRLYFFYSFLIMVAFGLFNGLLVQSALLVLIPINPTAFKQPMFGDSDSNAARRYSADSFGEAPDKLEMGTMNEATEFD